MFKLVVILMMVTMAASMAPRGKKPPINYKTHKWPALIKEKLPPNMPTYQQCIDAEKYWPETEEVKIRYNLLEYIDTVVMKQILEELNGSNIISTPQNSS